MKLRRQHEHPRLDEAVARSHLYPRSTQVDVLPLNPPVAAVKEARPPGLFEALGGARAEQTFDNGNLTG